MQYSKTRVSLLAAMTVAVLGSSSTEAYSAPYGGARYLPGNWCNGGLSYTATYAGNPAPWWTNATCGLPMDANAAVKTVAITVNQNNFNCSLLEGGAAYAPTGTTTFLGNLVVLWESNRVPAWRNWQIQCDVPPGGIIHYTYVDQD